MKNRGLISYLLFLVPAALATVALYVLDSSTPPADLLKVGLLIPLLSLAVKGLAGFFPAEDLAHRSTARLAEHALIQGLVFGAFMVFLRDLLQPEKQSDLVTLSLQVFISAGVMGVANFAMAFNVRRKLNAAGRPQS